VRLSHQAGPARSVTLPNPLLLRGGDLSRIRSRDLPFEWAKDTGTLRVSPPTHRARVIELLCDREERNEAPSASKISTSRAKVGREGELSR